jgi:Spy/CpxP family protein refolding chaperone
MKRKVFIIALATLLVVGTISIAFSRGHGRRGRGFGSGLGYGQRMESQVPEELKLTQEQKEKLQSLQTDFAKETIPLRNEMQIKELELRQLWLADELDEEAILAKSKEISDLRNQMQEKMVRHRLDAAKVLTKEQRTQFSQIGPRERGKRPLRGLHKLGRGGRRGRGRGGRFGMGGVHHGNW